ncbi:hypothetical protein Calhy_0431 [Caldicellulosiruptor hydrothermalis 108]|uniref:Uncharacterized protein n=1 Tax=Caldicellulosiruptor hydrothermalis (strain DSM 18901 / VKM B-2411 / 108) TaxID=632292 RepID=E4QC04_CALH1|nr:hypothetical protein [Caldicellulosiruptor hydrothermalis]ADQ06178.1 hypothetical protein Calhy_0431 [Caldicellulosiruptor hydrothermalis 108]
MDRVIIELIARSLTLIAIAFAALFVRANVDIEISLKPFKVHIKKKVVR